VPIEKIKQAAETNEVTAQYYLANAYSDGIGVTNNEAEAFKWMKLAAQQGMARAQRNLGWKLQNGLGVETNLDEAAAWYQKAAEQGDASAQFNLGWMYENGVNVSQDYAEAAKFYRLAAEQGHAMAQNNLGWLYFHFHEGVPQDSAEGMKWYQKSAEQGEPLAEENLARAYAMDGTNFDLAEKWMKKAVDLNSPEGQYEYADLLMSEFDKEGHQIRTNFPAAAEWFRKAAEQGYNKAPYQLADMYHSGNLGDDQRSNCIPWFLKAAAQGNAEAQAIVGELPKYYPNSELLKSVNTIQTLRQGAESGNLNAQFQLARRYQTGDGVHQDLIEAFKWMQMAAQQDQTKSSRVSDAIYDLALMYEKGEGVTNNLSEAHDLFLQAAAGHQPDATFRVGQMYEKGDGVPQDDHRAMEFYCNKIYNMNYPAKYPNGYVEYGPFGDGAAESLLRLWSQGRGFQNDKDKAEPGYHESAYFIGCFVNLIKTTNAQFYAGEIYYQGKLVPQDLVEAAAWFRLAANQGSDDARKTLDELEPKLLPAQKEAAKKRFDDFKKRLEQVKMNDETLEKAKALKTW
jgi:TPR repeat protein